jgi:hypothetical protein
MPYVIAKLAALALKRVLNIDVSVCPICGGEASVIARIEDQPIIDKVPSLGPSTVCPCPTSLHNNRRLPDGLLPEVSREVREGVEEGGLNRKSGVLNILRLGRWIFQVSSDSSFSLDRQGCCCILQHIPQRIDEENVEALLRGNRSF